MCRARRQAK